MEAFGVQDHDKTRMLRRPPEVLAKQNYSPNSTNQGQRLHTVSRRIACRLHSRREWDNIGVTMIQTGAGDAAVRRRMQHQTCGLAGVRHLAAHELEGVSQSANNSSKNSPVPVFPISQILPDVGLGSSEDRMIHEDDVQNPAHAKHMHGLVNRVT